MLSTILLSILIGLCFSCCGIGYRIAGFGKVYPIQCAAFLSVFGMIVFGLLGFDQWRNLSLWTAGGGAVFGITQYAAIRLLRTAFKLGPFSPAWCAISLNFVIVIVYAALCLGESLSVWQNLAILATVGAIVSASLGNSNGNRISSLRKKAVYGCLLVVILVFSSVINVGLKFFGVHIPAGEALTVSESSGYLVLFFTYLFMGGCAALDLSLSRTWRINKYAWWGGSVMTVGAIFGFFLTLLLITRPAIYVFALSYAASILSAALISSFFMGEKRTAAWYFTIGFSILAILLNH